MLPTALAIGVPYNVFWKLTPKTLKAHHKAFTIKEKHMDEFIWSVCGNYVLSAVAVAVENCLAGKKAKLKFIEKPLYRVSEEKEYTEEELKKQREMFVMMLNIKKANFELSHKSGERK